MDYDAYNPADGEETGPRVTIRDVSTEARQAFTSSTDTSPDDPNDDRLCTAKHLPRPRQLPPPHSARRSPHPRHRPGRSRSQHLCPSRRVSRTQTGPDPAERQGRRGPAIHARLRLRRVLRQMQRHPAPQRREPQQR